ncbi:MAG TPA: hypothetical protein VF144_12025 [Chitinophagaceae bacterium]
MDRYLIISTHEDGQCQKVMDYFREYHAGFLTHFEFGCNDGDHHAYAFIDADSREAAMLSVPPYLRNKTKAIKVNTLDPQSKNLVHTKQSNA